MATLDTNILIRFLVGDDSKQSELARRYIATASTNGESLFVPLSVLAEMEWVLRSRYEFKKQEVLGVVSGLLETREVQFQEEASVEIALFLYGENNVDFADCLHLASAMTHGQTPLMTFDRKASNIDGALLLSE